MAKIFSDFDEYAVEVIKQEGRCWNKILFASWLFDCLVLGFLTYALFYLEMGWFPRVILLFGFIECFLLNFFLFSTASGINSHTNEGHELAVKLNIHYIKCGGKDFKTLIKVKIKHKKCL